MFLYFLGLVRAGLTSSVISDNFSGDGDDGKNHSAGVGAAMAGGGGDKGRLELLVVTYYFLK